MRNIKITSEWVLDELPNTNYADGNGNISIYTDSVTDTRWLALALNTLGIPFQEFEGGDDNIIFFGYEFRLEDVKTECPNLYLKWKQLDETNRGYRVGDGDVTPHQIETLIS